MRPYQGTKSNRFFNVWTYKLHPDIFYWLPTVMTDSKPLNGGVISIRFLIGSYALQVDLL